MTNADSLPLQHLLEARFSDADQLNSAELDNDVLRNLASHGSCRAFRDTAVPTDLQDVLCAAALATPSKSDLQQRDIVLLRDPGRRAQLAQLVAGQEWVAGAPLIAVFCGNNRRARLLHDMHDIPFANDHFDAVFNAAADAAIALAAFVSAARSVGLGCCPISAVRNEAAAVSDLLGLPAHVFPFAGLAIGYPAGETHITKRLPLSVTCHVDRYAEEGVESAIHAYDADRTAAHPYRTQRLSESLGISDTYGWSMDKARQYSQPERADFGAYIRARGFSLE